MSVRTSMSCGEVSDPRRSSDVHGSDQCALRCTCGPEATYWQHSLCFCFYSQTSTVLGTGTVMLYNLGWHSLVYWPVAWWGVVPTWGIGQPTWFSFLRLILGSSDIDRNQQMAINQIHLSSFISLIFPCYVVIRFHVRTCSPVCTQQRTCSLCTSSSINDIVACAVLSMEPMLLSS